MTEQTPGISEKPIQPEVVSEAQPSKSYLKIVLLVVLGLIILAGAVYAGITIGKKQSPPEITPQAVEASPTPDETANWKTYKNEVLGYTLKYPSDWELNESESDGYPYIGLIDPIAQKMAPSQTEIDRGAMIEIYTAPWLGKDKSLLSLQKSLSSVEETAPSQEQETPVKVKESTKGQITGMWKSLRTEKVSGETFAFFREYEGKTLVFRVTITVFNSKDQTQPLTDSYLTIFDQILSTFKFLDESSTDETANWKTYRNEKYGISFKYPSDWTEQPYELGGSTAIVGVAKEGLEIPAQVTVGVSYWDNPKNLSLDKFEEENTGPDSGMGPGVYEPNGQWIKVNGVGAYRKRQGNCEPVNCDKVVIPRGNKIFALKNYFMGDQSTFESIFNQILSTFKFLDQKTDETANWKTYRDSVASFEIKYPANWSYTIKSKTTTFSSPDQPNKPTYSGSLSFIGPEGQIDLVFGDGFGGAPCREAIGPSAQLIGVKIGNYTVHLCNYSQGGRTYYASPFGDAGGPTVANASYNFTFSYLESSAQSKDLILKILSTFKFLE